MPCEGCGKQNAQLVLVQRLNQNLDNAVQFLSAAWITDIDPERREICSQIIHAVQLLAQPHVIPLEMQLQGLHVVSNQVGGKILCRYCRMFTYYDMVKSAEVHWRLARGEQWLACKVYVEKEIKKIYWLGPARLFEPILTTILYQFKRHAHRRTKIDGQKTTLTQ